MLDSGFQSFAAGQTLTGTQGADTITGTSGDDIISGLGGNDTLQGGTGNDTVDGGDGDDRIEDVGGSDTLRGGAGNDTFVVQRSNNGLSENVRIEGGSGNDDVFYQNYRAGSLSVDLGEGNDIFKLWTIQSAGTTLTLGAGADTLVLVENLINGGNGPLKITDFQVGPAGDNLDLSGYLNRALQGWNGSDNPFGSIGFLRLNQSGANTIIEIDSNGTVGGANFINLLTLDNVTASQLTANNLGGFPGDGSAVPGLTITGTGSTETLTGTSGDDTISGLGGNDTIDGRAGNDVINGGADNDTLQGGTGNDTVDGGDGDDRIEDVGGSDTLRGGAGNDTFVVQRSNNGLSENVRIEGGSGNDDVFYQNYRAGSLSVDLGEGNDIFKLWTIQSAGTTLTLGAGADTLVLVENLINGGNGPLKITDFQVGPAGDNLDLSGYLNRALQGWNGSDNPFGSIGFLRLNQSGANTIIEIDSNGTVGGANFINLLTLDNVTASQLTANNLGGFSYVKPAATAVVSVPSDVGEGTDSSIAIRVTLLNVASASGVLTFSFDNANSSVTNGSDVSVTNFSQSFSVANSPARDFIIDIPSISITDDALSEGTEFLTLNLKVTGQVFDSGSDTMRITIPIFDNEPTGTAGADTLVGTRGKDVISGLAGNDSLSGRGGDDLLIGGGGSDFLDGGAGFDVAAYSGMRKTYRVDTQPDSASFNTLIAQGPEGGTDTLRAIEQARFVDGVLSFDPAGNAAIIMRLYDATFKRAPEPQGLEGWLGQLSNGLTLKDMASFFAASPEFSSTFGSLTNQQFVEQLYVFALGRSGEPAGVQGWVDSLNAGTSRGDVLLGFSESQEHQILTAGQLAKGLWIADKDALVAARMYDSALGRLPDSGIIGWVNALKTGLTVEGMAAAFIQTTEFTTRFGGLTDRQFVEQLYQFTLDRTGEPDGVQGWVNFIAAGGTRAQVLAAFSESVEHVSLTAPLWYNGVSLLEEVAQSAQAEMAESSQVDNVLAFEEGALFATMSDDKETREAEIQQDEVIADYAGIDENPVDPNMANIAIHAGLVDGTFNSPDETIILPFTEQNNFISNDLIDFGQLSTSGRAISNSLFAFNDITATAFEIDYEPGHNILQFAERDGYTPDHNLSISLVGVTDIVEHGYII